MEQKPGGASCAPAPRKERVTALANVCAVKMENITKRFGKVTANKDVTLELYKGEILSLLGENGSGKTTLMNMLSGIYFPDEGQIYIDGQPVTIASPKDAFALGIGMIHQHFKLVDVFTATENIILGMPGKLNLAEARKKVKEICDRYGFDIDPDQKIYDMSVSQKQTVEIVKVLYRGANILILDEPTAVLTPQETDKLFAVMRNMKNDGKSLIIITHKLHEVLDVSDRVAVLRKGEYIGCVQTKDANQQSLTDMMVGHAVTLNIDRPTPVNVKPRLDIKGLTVFDEMGVKRLDDVTFTVNAGEVLGIAPNYHDALLKGLIGAGYTFKTPGPASCCIFTVKDSDKPEFVDIAWKLKSMGYKLYGTSGTCAWLNKHMVPCNEVRNMSGESPNIVDLLQSGLVDYVFSTSAKGRDPKRDSVRLRRKAVELSIPCITAVDTANALVDCLRSDHDLKNIPLVDIATLYHKK